jgi:hypothetical protein
MNIRASAICGAGALVAFAAFFTGCASTPRAFTAAKAQSTPVVLPFSLEHSLPAVELLLGGKRVRLIVDSGADKVAIALKPASMEGIRLEPTKHAAASLDINGARHEERSFVVREGAIGDLALRDISVSEESRDFVPCDGILGNAFLSRFKVLLDYRESTMTLYPLAGELPAFASGSWEVLPFKRGVAGIMLDCSWSGGGKGSFCLDTGSSVGIVDTARLAPADLPDLSGANGPPMALLRDFSAGGLPLGELGFVAQDLSHLTPNGAPFAGLLGYNFLRDRRVIIDFQKARLLVDSAGS